MRGFVMNTRRPVFEDRRVREALALSFDWAWINDRLYRGQFARMDSYFANSLLAFDGTATELEHEILAPFAGELPPDTLETGWSPPQGEGTGRNRRNMRAAGRLLDAANWRVRDGIRVNADGEPLTFEILAVSTGEETIAALWRESLARLGVQAEVRLVDRAQYNLRRESYDYDVIVNFWAMSLSPGTEQQLYFGSYGRETPGTRNYMGVAEPAVDAAIDAILRAEDKEDFRAAVRALDRVLTSGIYVIPFGALPNDRLVWQSQVSRPAKTPIYGWWGWWAGPGVWWRAPAE